MPPWQTAGAVQDERTHLSPECPCPFLPRPSAPGCLDSASRLRCAHRCSGHGSWRELRGWPPWGLRGDLWHPRLARIGVLPGASGAPAAPRRHLERRSVKRNTGQERSGLPTVWLGMGLSPPRPRCGHAGVCEWCCRLLPGSLVPTQQTPSGPLAAHHILSPLRGSAVWGFLPCSPDTPVPQAPAAGGVL